MSTKKPKDVGKQAQVQRDGEPPVMKMVIVAALIPSLSAAAAGGALQWDESLCMFDNDYDTKEPGRFKKIMIFLGLLDERVAPRIDAPPFRFRAVPYEEWRKHYAKDAHGNYHGTEEPAEDCILKPEDEFKWRTEKLRDETLPSYTDGPSEKVPEYTFERYDPPPAEPVVDDNVATPPPFVPSLPAINRRPSAARIADGKTAQEIIAEAKRRASQPEAQVSWLTRMKRDLGIGSSSKDIIIA